MIYIYCVRCTKHFEFCAITVLSVEFDILSNDGKTLFACLLVFRFIIEIRACESSSTVDDSVG